MPTFAYILVRDDLTAAQAAVQASHAALEAGAKFSWPPETHIALLSVKSHQALLEASWRLESAGIEHSLFYEPDDDLQETALCTRPVEGEERKHFKRWQLWAG